MGELQFWNISWASFYLARCPVWNVNFGFSTSHTTVTSLALLFFSFITTSLDGRMASRSASNKNLKLGFFQTEHISEADFWKPELI